MDEFKTYALTFPLVEEYTRVSDALEQTNLHSIDAVVSTDGKAFWLHNRLELAVAARNSPSKTLAEFRRHQLPVLNTKQVAELGLDLTVLDKSQIVKYFSKPDIDVVVTSVISDMAGNRMVVGLANPDGIFRVVSKVWVCPDPNGGERYRSPGICPAHGAVLQPET
jgi:hypothetical protein